MATKSKAEYDMQYAKENLKRIPLNVQKRKYEEIKAAASAVGESVNGYIKKAIDSRLKSDSATQEGDRSQCPHYNHSQVS